MRSYLVVGVVALSSCMGYLPELRAVATTEFKCPEESLVIDAVGANEDMVRGCGKENIFTYDHGQSKWVSPLDRASFDLSCPKDQLTWQVLGSRQVGITGCAKKAVYVVEAAGWIANTEGPAPSSPASSQR